MKKNIAAWKSGDKIQMPLYNFFVTVHANSGNSLGWHGTTLFLPAHTYFLYLYESAMIYTAWNYWDVIGLSSQQDACGICLPYWDWILDYDPDVNDYEYPLYNSAIWGKYFGTIPQDFDEYYSNGCYVKDGYFTQDNWVTTFPVSGDAYYPSDPNAAFYDNGLKRLYDAADFPLQYGPLETIYGMTQNRNFKAFSLWLESGPHSGPHMSIYYTMSLMFSPDDPLFWMHHSNLDRIYKCWIDCNEYEFVSNLSLTYKQYEGANPVSYEGRIAYNPYTGFKYAVTADSKIPYYYQSSGDSDIFPHAKWPTPRQVWGANPTQRGYDGVWYCYGYDALVAQLGSSCTSNVKWTLVHQTTKKTIRR